jgi:hypothetical protein
MVLVGALALAGCARAAPEAAPPVPTAPLTAVVAAPPASAPVTASAADASTAAPAPKPDAAPRPATAGRCTGDLPPAEHVRDNMQVTHVAGLAEIVSATKTGTDGKTPAPTSGYAHVRYEVRVLRWFAGQGPERRVLVQGVEAESIPRAPGSLLFFTACTGADATAFEPDVGHFFSVDPACRAEAEALGDAAAKRARAGGKHEPVACGSGKKR